ncbi:MAG: CAP domain-containing protein [Cyanobacteria bacterium P01_C01_bin.89]
MTGTVTRIYDVLTGSHVYTTNEAEIAQLTADPARYRNEGAAFDSIGPSPVVRFLNQVTGGIFYAISPAEQNDVRQNPGFLEIPGGGFDAAIAPQSGLVPVYRFYNTVTGRHFFTPNAQEAASVRANLPGYRDEGVGFFADPAGEAVSAPTPAPAPTPVSTPSPTSTFEQEVVTLVNEARARSGLAPLVYDPLLGGLAESHSEDMLQRDFFSHTSPDGVSFSDRVQQAAIPGPAAENIGVGYATPQAAVTGWLNSSGHRANILNPSFTKIGVGHVFSANDPGTERWNHYWTQVFQG